MRYRFFSAFRGPRQSNCPRYRHGARRRKGAGRSDIRLPAVACASAQNSGGHCNARATPFERRAFVGVALLASEDARDQTRSSWPRRLFLIGFFRTLNAWKRLFARLLRCCSCLRRRFGRDRRRRLQGKLVQRSGFWTILLVFRLLRLAPTQQMRCAFLLQDLLDRLHRHSRVLVSWDTWKCLESVMWHGSEFHVRWRPAGPDAAVFVTGPMCSVILTCTRKFCGISAAGKIQPRRELSDGSVMAGLYSAATFDVLSMCWSLFPV